jgi:hypothetical protein
MTRNSVRISIRPSYYSMPFVTPFVSDQDEGASAFRCRPGLPPLHDDPLHVFVAPSLLLASYSATSVCPTSLNGTTDRALCASKSSTVRVGAGKRRLLLQIVSGLQLI